MKQCPTFKKKVGGVDKAGRGGGVYAEKYLGSSSWKLPITGRWSEENSLEAESYETCLNNP